MANKMDEREKQDLIEEIQELALSYVPEWKFSVEHPDVGSVIALIFAEQMETNIRKFNQVLEKYHTEFVNMIGIALRPAQPACAMIAFDMSPSAIGGVRILKGTRFIGNRQQETSKRLIFESSHDIYVTNSRLSHIFMTEGFEGKIRRVYGNFPQVSYTPAEEITEGEQKREFKMFDFKGSGDGKSAVLIYHSSLFDICNDNIYLKFPGNNHIVDEIKKGWYRILYNSCDGIEEVSTVTVSADTVIIRKEKENQTCIKDGKNESVLILERKFPTQDMQQADTIGLSSIGQAKPPDYAGDGNWDYEIGCFYPFQEELTLYEECYIGCEAYFHKPGAVVTIEFQVEFGRNEVGIPPMRQEENFRIIKRREREHRETSSASCYCSQISFEYFNGKGWKRLECKQNVSNIFGEGQQGRKRITFLNPTDWEKITVGHFEGYCIRMQILRADNCYVQPCIHYYPIIKNMQVSYSYEHTFQMPEYLEVISGTKKLDLTKDLQQRKKLTLFQKPVKDTAVYLGFSQPFEEGPISILFQMEERNRELENPFAFEYSTRKGFSHLKLLDGTNQLCESGVIRFMPPADFSRFKLEGVECYWIRILDIKDYVRKHRKNLPMVKDIIMNVAETYNIETLAEEEYYIQEVQPYQKIRLNGENILDADIWVNETGSLTGEQMKTMLESEPDNAMAVYNFLGDIQQFYVKWIEVEKFDPALKNKRQYRIDRMKNEILFGDGIEIKIPQVTNAAAFKAALRCCQGEFANVEPDEINTPAENLVFVDQIYNPFRAYGGSNIETLDHALSRGANLLSTRKRLVSGYDFIRETLAFSDTIDKAACIQNRTIDGRRNPGCVSIVILMKDFEQGLFSFVKMKEKLRQYYRNRCELTLAMENLKIVSPIEVAVSVSMWVQVHSMDDNFEIQAKILDILTKFLNPVTGGMHHGFEIGELPRRNQIMMLFSAIREDVQIQSVVITCQYQDYEGMHECDLEELRENPFVICKNGTHRIHVMADI